MYLAANAATVLVVEDETFIRMTTADMLAEIGYNVLEAQDAEEALVVLDGQDKVHILFTDINMPGLYNGLDLVGMAREKQPFVRVVITSGAIRLGPNELPPGSTFLPKPYRPAELARVMNEQKVAAFRT